MSNAECCGTSCSVGGVYADAFDLLNLLNSSSCLSRLVKNAIISGRKLGQRLQRYAARIGREVLPRQDRERTRFEEEREKKKGGGGGGGGDIHSICDG